MRGKPNKKIVKKVPTTTKKQPKASNKKSPEKKKAAPKKKDTETNIIEQLVQAALQDQIETGEKRRIKDIEAFGAVIQEFLQSFIVIGYDLDDEPVIVVNAKTQKDSDSLSTLCGKFLNSHLYTGN